MPEALLALDGVRAGYGDAVVLDDVSLTVPSHGSLALLGRNGVGKSTLLLDHHGFHADHPRRGHVAGSKYYANGAAPPRPRRDRLGGAGARDLPRP